MSEAPTALVDVLQPVLDALDLSLYDVEIVGSGGAARTVRVLVDDPQAAEGIGLDQIALATEAVSPALDRAADDPATGVARILPGAYTLEVSSPGLERPLHTVEHWRGAVGTTVSVRTSHADETLRRRGVVVAVDDLGADLDIDAERERVAFADVVQARTVFEWGPSPKPGGPKSKKSKPGSQPQGSKARTRRADEKVKR
jgi:ribosome maturation factor RimP